MMGVLFKPDVQYLVALSLAICGVGSFVFVVVHARAQNAEGKIKLPSYGDDDDEWDSRLALSGEGVDPFDVTKPEDVVDGYPIDEDAFWLSNRKRKAVLMGLLALVVAVQAVHLGWSWTRRTTTTTLVTRVLHVVYSTYVLLLSLWSIPIADVEENWRSLVHLSTLTTMFTISQLTVAILLSETSSSTPSIALWYSSITLYLASTLIAARTKCGPKLHFPAERIYSEKVVKATTAFADDNVSGFTYSSVLDYILFSYTTQVVMLGHTAESLEIGDLPIVQGSLRATTIFSKIRDSLKKPTHAFKTSPGSGWGLMLQLWKLNWVMISTLCSLAIVSAMFYYAPAFFIRKVVQFLEEDEDRQDLRLGWAYCAGLIAVTAIGYLIAAQLWSIATTTLQVRIKVQLNSTLFAKTLVRKDVASSAPNVQEDPGQSQLKEEKEEFSSKAQIMTLMTTDVDRVSGFAWQSYTLVDCPIEIAVGTAFLYQLIGSSAFLGIFATCLFMPVNHFAGKFVMVAQDSLMKARDERVALMNEVLGAIRMLKFMAWERSFEKRVMAIREKELKYQRMNYNIEIMFNAIWGISPLIVTLVSFWHFAVYRGQVLTPSIAFTSIAILAELKFALNALPETFINVLQSLVSLRRIEKYLGSAEIAPVPPLAGMEHPIAFRSATITWAQERSSGSNSGSASGASTPSLRRKFLLVDLSLNFPVGELSLVCGKLGSGKTLLLLSLLGETELLAGQISCPRSPPNIIASFKNVIPKDDEWVVSGVCAYVPQTAWLQNASIRENILFNLPYDESRFQRTLEACALVSDLEILVDGDESEIGERGVNLSGGQKARISLARAVYSRASTLFLDDVLSAVDAHTADHLYSECLKGDLMRGRTIILVSHHVQLCASGAKYIVALENGRAAYAGAYDGFSKSKVMSGLVQSDAAQVDDLTTQAKNVDLGSKEKVEKELEDRDDTSETSSTAAASSVVLDSKPHVKKSPLKLIEEEARAVGRVKKEIWQTYVDACGGRFYWVLFVVAMVAAALTPVFENGWLKIWSGDSQTGKAVKGPMYYLFVYALVTIIGLIINTVRWFVLYRGSINASVVLYQRLLETVLFAQIRFHDTTSRGRLLNRFGKDFEGIDSSLSDAFGRTWFSVCSLLTTVIAICAVGGIPFVLAATVAGYFYYKVAKVYGQCSRDMRRLDSVTRSPLYSMYGETIAGVPVVRAFGASSKFLRDMLQCVDVNVNPYYWMWGVNRWLSARFNVLSSVVIGCVAFVAISTPGVDASLAGFALAFAGTIASDVISVVRRFVSLEQSMVALERVKEFTDIPREQPEFVDPRPPSDWPNEGRVEVQDLVIRYSPELPNVLHSISFIVQPGEKVGILGRTGSGKSTLALSFFRFVEATEGRILVDGTDISKIGLTDLRSKLTIIPQDPTILSGTLRSTLDVFSEYEDAEIYEALRRVHLIRNDDNQNEDEEVNANVFRNLDALVSEGGDNFSTGEKQLLCMARAILKRSRVLVMDEATASVDCATDELIGKTIRNEFATSTILTIAHRIRTVIDYDRVMILDNGQIAEFDSPAKLLSDPSSKFCKLCQATGNSEFVTLRRMAALSSNAE